MTLRKKTLIVIGATIVCLIMIPYFMLRGILRESVEKLEVTTTRQSVRQTLSFVDSTLTDLDTTTFDWASWDSMYSFAVEPNEEFVKANLPDDNITFTSLRLDLKIILNNDRKVLYGKVYDKGAGLVRDLPENIRTQIAGSDLMAQHKDTNSAVKGLVMVSSGPMLICSRPILKTSGEGSIHGTVIFGRYIDEEEIKVWQEHTHLSLSVCSLDDPQMPADFRQAVSAISRDSAVFVKPLSANLIGGYTIMNDVYGKPALVLKAEMPREIYRQGKANIAQFILYFLPVGLVFGVIVLFIVERIVVSRLSRLSKRVSAIGASGDLSARLEVAGKDEVANVAGEVNKMLETLEQSDAALKTSKELKRAKEAAEQATAKLRVEKMFSENIIETANSIIVALDCGGRITTFNRYAEELTGYHRDEVLGKNWFETFLSEDLRARVHGVFDELLKTADHSNHENPIACKDGTERLVLWSNSVLKDAGGKSIGVLAIGTDVTERRHAEEALRQSEERYRSVIDNIGIGVALISPNMEILALNKQMREWNPAVDASQKPICYKAFNNPPRENVCSYCPTYKTLEDGQIHESITATPTNGGIRNYRVVSSPITGKDGKIVAAIEMVDDVTERLRQEKALRESKYRQEAILNSIPDIAWLKDREGKYVAANEAMGRTAGMPPAEMVGKTDLAFWPEDLARHYMADDREIEATGKRKLIEEPLVSADGSRTWVETIKTPVFGENGEVIGTTGIARDVTERKRTEDEIREARDKAEAISRELAAKMGELELFNRLAVGREMMIELKRKINGLCEKHGEKPPYDLSAVATGQAENGTENGDAAETAGTKEK